MPGRFALSPRTPLMVSAAASLVLLAACGSSASGPQSVRGPATGSAPTGTPPAGYAPWAQAENSPLHTSESTHTGPQDAKIRWKANLGGNISQGPSVGADGTIYEANDGGVLHALDPKTGADRWTFDGHGKIGSELSTTAAVLPDGTVLWPGPQHTVFGLSPAGKPLWSLKLAGTPLSPTIAAPDAFYVTTFSGDLVAVKITDGKAQARWTLHLGKQNWASPVLRADGVIETTVDNTLVAVKDEGAKARTLWQFATKKPIEVSPAVTSGGITVLGSNDGFEFGISPTGKQLWKVPVGGNSFSSPAVTSSGTAYFGDNKGVLTVVDATSGKVLQSIKGEPDSTDPGKIWTAPLVDSAGNIYYGTNHGQIFGFTSTGTPLLRVETGKVIASYPALTADGDLLIGSNDGNLYSVGAEQPADMTGQEAAGDDMLLAAIGRADAGAYATFFDRHADRVYGLACTVLRDPDSAKDATQETFLRVWRFADSFDARRGSALGWLLTITRNLCADLARSEGRSVVTDPGRMVDLLGLDEGPGPAESASIADDISSVRAVLLTLPPEQLRAVLLARWHGQSVAEISAIEGVPVGTVRSRLRLALARMHATLSDSRQSGPC